MTDTQFHGKAGVYANARPGYPREALQYVNTLVQARALANPEGTAMIADVGAGTGKFTVPLAGLGFPVLAVEPDGDMRAELRARTASLPNVTVLDGSAEHTGLPSHGIDVITVAQALHWFSPSGFPAECRRIARNGRYLLVSLYNVTSFDSAMKNAAGPSAVSDGERAARLSGSIRHSRETQTRFFRNPTVRKFANPIRYTRDSWRAYMDSHSHSPLPGSPEYPAHRAWVDVAFDARAVNGILTDDTVCVVASELFDASAVTPASVAS